MPAGGVAVTKVVQFGPAPLHVAATPVVEAEATPGVAATRATVLSMPATSEAASAPAAGRRKRPVREVLSWMGDWSMRGTSFMSVRPVRAWTT